jgi:hypothetical protein
VHRGLIKNIDVKINGIAENGPGQEGYQIAALTVFGNKDVIEDPKK